MFSFLRLVLVAISLSAQIGCLPGPPTLAFIDKVGRVKIRLGIGQGARSFSEGLAAVSLIGKWGLINQTGHFVIAPQFGAVEDFSDGLALVTNAPRAQYWDRNTLFGYIDRTGKYAVAPRFNWAGKFAEGIAPACIGSCRGPNRTGGSVGYIGRDGGFVLVPRYSQGSRFSEGLAVAAIGNGVFARVGYIDKSGEFVIPPRFLYAEDFSEGLAATNEGFINRHGEVVIVRTAIQQGGNFANGWAARLDGDRPVFIDRIGRVTLRPNRERIGPFTDGLAPACSANCGPSALGSGQNWGFINKGGKFVIKPQYGYRPEPFHDGLALVCFGCKG